MRTLQANFAVILFAIVLLTALTAQSLAATPTLVKYQGRITNAAGAPVPNGVYPVAFSIYGAPTGGPALWTETQSVTAASGLFSVLLGSTTPLTDAVFSNTTTYLGVKVGADPELSPRTMLVTVPYAYRVSTVDGSTGGAVSGNIDLDSSTTLTGNIYKNGTLFLHNGGGFANTCLGIHAGNLNMSGDRNTAIGLESMLSNSTGEQNTAIGAGALTLNVSGHQNTATGFGALYKSLGTQNTAVGALSLYSNVYGSYNTAAGYGALYNNTADGNTAFGHNAVISNTSGKANCGFGKDVLYSNTSGDSNTASGCQALFYNTYGKLNTATGSNALLNNDAGIWNTGDGADALLNNTSGSSNTACGYSALRNLNGSAHNSAFGAIAMASLTSGQDNTAIGRGAMSNLVSGSYNIAIGGDAQCAQGISNATVIGVSATVNSSNMIRLGNTNITKIEGQVAYTFTSDRNQKENFQPVDGDQVLKKLTRLSATSWNYMGQDPQQFRHYGPMAQEFFEAFGHDGFGQSGDSTSINSGDMAGVMLVAIQALEKRVAELQTEIETLKKESGKK